MTAIIVGAGPAGSTAAYVLAKGGHDVVMVERGDSAGCKNMFGGRMYSHALERVIPGFWEEAPVERAVVRETVTFIHGGRSVSVVCDNPRWAAIPPHSFTLLRAEFDSWLASKAEEAGAMVACGIRVDDVLMADGKVVGIRAGEDEMLADVVIAADGVNSVLAQKAGLAKMFAPSEVAVGVKQVIEIPAAEISRLFQLGEGEGAVELFVGDCSRGMQGGGFLYTNKNSVSLGLVVGAAALQRGEASPFDMLEDFKAQPRFSRVLEHGEVGEYSAHLVPEAGINMVPKLFGDGMLVVGDAAGLVLNLGYIVRGMDFAVASGEAAAKAVVEAKSTGDFSRHGLSHYKKLLDDSFVLRDLTAYRRAPRFLENQRLFEQHPRLATELVSDLFTVDGGPPRRLSKTVRNRLRGRTIAHLVADGWRGVRGL